MISITKFRPWLLVATLAAGGIVGFVAASLGVMPVPSVSVRWSVPALQVGDYAPSAGSDAGDELVFVYVGSSTCGWSNVPELPDLVRTLKLRLQERAGAEGMSFAAVGVARDMSAANGMAHLDGFRIQYSQA